MSTRKATPKVPPQQLLTTNEAAKVVGVATDTLTHYRFLGKGPRFLRRADRRVFYDMADLQRYCEERAQQQFVVVEPGSGS